MLKSGGKERQKGFTIVELMISLTVLSTILLMATFIMMQIGALYSKGVNSANLQNANRALMSELSGTLQLSGYAPSACTPAGDTCYAGSSSLWSEPGGDNVKVYAYCINNIRYSYVMEREATSSNKDSDGRQTPHVMWRDTMSHAGTDAASCPPLNITQANIQSDGNSQEGSGLRSQGFDIVGNRMRLTRFFVSENPASSGIYSIETSMAFGDSDLLCDSGTPGDCNLTTPSTRLGNPTPPAGPVFCKGQSGQQFCATSQLSSTVTRRII